MARQIINGTALDGSYVEGNNNGVTELNRRLIVNPA